MAQAVFVDPVVAADGKSYERAATQSWLSQHGAVSPTTGQALDHCDLLPTTHYAARSIDGNCWECSSRNASV